MIHAGNITEVLFIFQLSKDATLVHSDVYPSSHVAADTFLKALTINLLKRCRSLSNR